MHLSNFFVCRGTEMLCTKIHIYKLQEIDWKCFWIYFIYRLLTIWVRRKKIHILEISLKELFSKHKNWLGHPLSSSDWAKNWITYITFHLEWENQLKVWTFRLLAHWATLVSEMSDTCLHCIKLSIHNKLYIQQLYRVFKMRFSYFERL